MSLPSLVPAVPPEFQAAWWGGQGTGVLLGHCWSVRAATSMSARRCAATMMRESMEEIVAFRAPRRDHVALDDDFTQLRAH